MGWQVVQDEFIASAKLQAESGEKWILSYFLQTFDCNNGETFFGLRIDKSTPGGTLLEREETLAITESREEALIMARAFAKGSVPPVTLLEMTDEWHSEVRLLPA